MKINVAEIINGKIKAKQIDFEKEEYITIKLENNEFVNAKEGEKEN